MGWSVPQPAVIKAQLDTGAHRTGIDRRIFEQLELWGEIDTEYILTGSTEEEPHPAPVYVANVTILGAEGDRTFDTLLVIAHSFGAHEQARAVIGRDILDHCHLTWEGPQRKFSLVF
jgi:hypothetical protein